MTRFRCLAGDCEATCCGGGTIPVGEDSHRHLTLLANGNAEALALIHEGVERTPGGPGFARVRFDDDGECRVRDGAGLCKIHQRFGHEALFEVCATFPRYASKVDEDVELFGSLACPEVARLALLADDAFELANVTLEEPPRILRNHFRTDSTYFRAFKPVRAALVGLISEAGYGLAEKLFVLLWGADKLKGVLHQGAAEVPPAELDHALGALSDPQVLSSLTASFRKLAIEGELALSVIIAALRPPLEPRRGAQTAGFDAIWRNVVGRFGPALAPGSTASPEDVRRAWSDLARLRAQLPEATDARMDSRLTRYVVNHLLTTPYMLWDSVFEFAYDLVVRVASLRFLLTTELYDAPLDDAQLDAEIVRVTFSFVRAVEHTDAPARLGQLLRAQGLDGFAHAVGFLAMWRPAT